MATIAVLDVLLRANVKAFETGLSQANAALKQFNSAFSSLQSALSTIGIGAGIGSLSAAMFDVVKQAEESYISQQRLAAVLDATGNSAGFTANELANYAKQLSKISGVDDEAIQGAEALVATFGNIQGENFKKTIKLALDLSRVFGKDVSESALTLGKALSEPEDASGKLLKAGVRLTDSQKRSIQTMVEMNDIAGAQAAIIDALEHSVGGAAEKMRSAWDSVKVSFGDLMEEIGKVGTTGGPGGGIANIIAKTIDMTTHSVERMNALIDLFTLGVQALTGTAEHIDIKKIVPDESVVGLTEKQSDALKKLTQSLVDEVRMFGMSSDAMKIYKAILDGIPEAELSFAMAVAKRAEEMATAAQIQRQQIQADQAFQNSVDSIIKSLEEHNATLGMSSEEIQIWKLRMMGADESVIDYAKSLIGATEHTKALLDEFSNFKSRDPAEMFQEMQDNIAKLRDMLDAGTLSIDAFDSAVTKLQKSFDKALEDRGKQIFDETRTPLEKLQKQIDELNFLFDQGAIDLDTYNRALQRAQDEYSNFLDMTEHRPAALEYGSQAALSAENAAMDLDRAQDEMRRLLNDLNLGLNGPGLDVAPGRGANNWRQAGLEQNDFAMDQLVNATDRSAESRDDLLRQVLQELRDIERNTDDAFTVVEIA